METPRLVCIDGAHLVATAQHPDPAGAAGGGTALSGDRAFLKPARSVRVIARVVRRGGRQVLAGEQRERRVGASLVEHHAVVPGRAQEPEQPLPVIARTARHHGLRRAAGGRRRHDARGSRGVKGVGPHLATRHQSDEGDAGHQADLDARLSRHISRNAAHAVDQQRRRGRAELDRVMCVVSGFSRTEPREHRRFHLRPVAMTVEEPVARIDLSDGKRGVAVDAQAAGQRRRVAGCRVGVGEDQRIEGMPNARVVAVHQMHLREERVERRRPVGSRHTI